MCSKRGKGGSSGDCLARDDREETTIYKWWQSVAVRNYLTLEVCPELGKGQATEDENMYVTVYYN